jgi:hypothetical protein
VSDSPKLSVSLSNDPRKWIPAIIGAVLLGESLWSLLQLLVRDWAVPAISNLLGQGPTHNQNAFLPQPLFIAFVETCLAGILLVLLMAWSTRRSWSVRLSVDQPATLSVPSAPRSPESVRTAPTVPAASIVPTPAPIAPPPAAPPRIEAPATSQLPREAEVAPIRTIVPETRPASPISTAETAELSEASAAPLASAATPKPPVPAPAPPKSKKPKKVYYNIVGEPIESDD